MKAWLVAQRRRCLRWMLSLHAEMLVSPNATNEAAYLYEYCSYSRLKLPDILSCQGDALQGVWFSPLDSSFHRFHGAQSLFTKRLLISSSSRQRFYDGATAETPNVVRTPAIQNWTHKKRGVHADRTKNFEMQCESRGQKTSNGQKTDRTKNFECNANRGNCTNTVEHAHTNFLDAHDKFNINQTSRTEYNRE